MSKWGTTASSTGRFGEVLAHPGFAGDYLRYMVIAPTMPDGAYEFVLAVKLRDDSPRRSGGRSDPVGTVMRIGRDGWYILDDPDE